MLAFALASLAAVTSDSLPNQPTTLKKEPTRYCRDMVNASSRLHSVKVCRTRAEWRRWEACHGSITRYCTPKKRDAVLAASLGRETAFPLNEDSRMICRIVAETGTRLSTARICLPRREWERMWKDSAEGTHSLQDRSTRVPGEPR